MKTFEYRLYPTRSQRILLMACLKESRELYNAMLERVKAQYKEDGTFIRKYALNKTFKGCGTVVPATTVQCVADRLDKALSRFLAAKKEDKPCGFPRFKKAHQWNSIHLRQWGRGKDAFLCEGHLLVPKKIGRTFKIKLHRPFEGTPKTCHLVLRADGHWYALIVCQMPEVPTDNSRPDVGLDMGLKSFLADSNGNTVDAPQFFRRTQAKLRTHQRTRSRRQKGSRRRKKAIRTVATLSLKVARQRRDWLFKAAKPYADRYGTIFVEDLNVSGMLKNHHLAKSIADASWATFLTILEHKAESAGGQVVRIPAQYTSQRCAGCGAMVPKSLSIRTHVCPECSLVIDRDVNAALNILRLGRSRQTRTWAESRPCVV